MGRPGRQDRVGLPMLPGRMCSIVRASTLSLSTSSSWHRQRRVKGRNMNRSYINRLIFAALAAAMLLVVAIGLPGIVTPSSGEAAGEAAGEPAITRSSRPHPEAHLRSAHSQR